MARDTLHALFIHLLIIWIHSNVCIDIVSCYYTWITVTAHQEHSEVDSQDDERNEKVIGVWINVHHNTKAIVYYADVKSHNKKNVENLEKGISVKMK